MKHEEPEGWRLLWLRAQQEGDSKRLAELIDQMNQLLDRHAKLMKENDGEFQGGGVARCGTGGISMRCNVTPGQQRNTV